MKNSRTFLGFVSVANQQLFDMVVVSFTHRLMTSVLWRVQSNVFQSKTVFLRIQESLNYLASLMEGSLLGVFILEGITASGIALNVTRVDPDELPGQLIPHPPIMLRVNIPLLLNRFSFWCERLAGCVSWWPRLRRGRCSNHIGGGLNIFPSPSCCMGICIIVLVMK